MRFTIITIQINKGLIASQLGTCTLVITNYGTEEITLDSPNDVTTLTLNAVGDYYITIISPSGQILFSNKITITEKLNSVAIIVIILVVALLAVGTFIFVRLRTRMRVK